MSETLWDFDRAWLVMGQQAEEAGDGADAILCYWLALDAFDRRVQEALASRVTVTSSGTGYTHVGSFYLICP